MSDESLFDLQYFDRRQEYSVVLNDCRTGRRWARSHLSLGELQIRFPKRPSHDSIGSGRNCFGNINSTLMPTGKKYLQNCPQL